MATSSNIESETPPAELPTRKAGILAATALYMVAATIFVAFSRGDFGLASAVFSQLSLVGLSGFYSYNLYTGWIKPHRSADHT